MMEGGEFWFDERGAELAVRFFERLLVHVKGEWAGERFALLPWQRDEVIRPLFGWKRADGTRRYRRAYIEIPRKNGKSTLSAGIALLLLFADGEPGAEVYSAAADRDQARIVFDVAKGMVTSSPHLGKRAQVFKNSIFVPESMSAYRVLSADAPTKHGLNAHGIVFDELHAQPNRELWDVLTTSMGARRQPLLVSITTAGFDRNSICWEQHEYARRVLAGLVRDESFFAYIAAADDEDDWLDRATWIKANPSLGATVKLDYLETEAARAREVPAYQNTFRRLHLNQWTQQETRWLDMRAWDACEGAVDEGELAGQLAYGGLDLASTSDIAAFVLVFPRRDGSFALLPRFYIPRENMLERARRDRVPYDAWARDGLVVATPGDVIDFEFILHDIGEMRKKYQIAEIAFDRWGATSIAQRLMEMGGENWLVEFGQGYASMAGPTKELLRLVMERKIAHGGNPVLRWMADNVVVREDPAGNVKPDKGKSREKIDGVVAAIMGLARALVGGGVKTTVYATRGLREL